METPTIFTERLLTDGYTLRARETRHFTLSEREPDTERISIGEPFNITVYYELEHFGIGLPMYVTGSNDTILVPDAFYYDYEQRVQAHLYRLDDRSYLVVQRYRDEDDSVRYIVERYEQNNPK